MNPFYRVPWYRPIPVNEDIDPSEIREMDYLVFRLRTTRLDWKEDTEYTPYFYYCETCHDASGSFDWAYRTGSTYAKDMKEGATNKQQFQMMDHAKQHEIMYRWAKGVK